MGTLKYLLACGPNDDDQLECDILAQSYFWQGDVKQKEGTTFCGSKKPYLVASHKGAIRRVT